VTWDSGTLTAFSRRRPKPTPVFGTYWRFAAERQRVFHAKAAGAPGPWTTDTILAAHRFTNAYRASDRVSQFLINEVIPCSLTDPVDVVFRTLLFKIFNRVSTWTLLEAEVGQLHAHDYEPEVYAAALAGARRSGAQIYSAAYIMPMPAQAGAAAKHEAHLLLLASLLAAGTLARIVEARSLRQVYDLLVAVPSFGPFLAFQYAIDLNYGPASGHSEMEFVVAGPGARSGIAKCFSDPDGLGDEDIIRYACERAEMELSDRGICFDDLWGRPLQLVDCQNLFCEVDKYARVAHPDIVGSGGRSRIKQRYTYNPEPLGYGFPEKWEINVPEPMRWGRNSKGRLATAVV